MATLDRAEQLEERFAMAVTQQGVQAVMKIEEAGLRWSVRTARDLPGTTAQALGDFADRIREDAEARRERAHEREFGSEVDLKEFSELGGKREVVDIEDDEVLEGVRQELRKHGVTFAVERDDDGNHYLHVRGSDADLIAHALNRVQESLDRERARTPQQEPDTPSEPTPERSPEFQKAHQEAHAYALYVAEQVSEGQSIELTDEQIEQLTTDALRERGFTPDGARIESPEQPTPDRGSRTGETTTRAHDGPTPGQADALAGRDTLPAEVREWARENQPDTLRELDTARGAAAAAEERFVGAYHQATGATPLPDTPREVELSAATAWANRDAPHELEAYQGAVGLVAHLEGRIIEPHGLEQQVRDLSASGPGDNSAEEAELARREEAYLNARKGTPDPLREGYESAPTADLRGHAAPDRPTVHGAASRGRDSLKGADSREQSKSLIREKIGALVNRIGGTSGPNAPTQKHGLDAHHHPKGPKR